MNKDWTDEFRASVSEAGVEPSDGAWERLVAAVPVRKVSWVPYTLAAAVCCAAVCCVFIFLSPAPEAEVLAEVAAVPADIPETEPATEAAVPGLAEAVSSSRLLAMAVTEADGPAAAAHAAAVPETELPVMEDAGVSVPVTEPADDVPAVHESTVPAGGAGVNVSGPASDPFTAEEEPVPTSRSKISVSASMGGGLASRPGGVVTHQTLQSGTLAVKGGNLELQYADVVDITDIVSHDAPLRFGLDILVPVSSRLSVRTGLEYTYLSSRVGNGGQEMKWLGVPLGLGYNVADWGFSRLDAGASVMAEKCLGATLLGISYSEKPQWSLGLDASWRVRISGPLYFTLTPGLSYYFTQTQLPTYRTSHPLSFTLHAGFTFQL